MSSRSLPLARAAFEAGSEEQSRDAHRESALSQEGGHQSNTQVGKSLFYSAFAGFSTSTLMLILSYSAGLPSDTAWRLAAGCTVGLSALRGLQDYAQICAERRMYDRERNREKWELANYPEGESREMVELWEEMGVPRAAAETAISALLPSTEFFVDLMMAQELKMQAVSSPPPPFFFISTFHATATTFNTTNTPQPPP